MRIGSPCTIPGCTKLARARRKCDTHYRAERREEKAAAGRFCAVADCGEVIHANGLCERHYDAQRRDIAARMTSQLVVCGDCGRGLGTVGPDDDPWKAWNNHRCPTERKTA